MYTSRYALLSILTAIPTVDISVLEQGEAYLAPTANSFTPILNTYLLPLAC